MGTLDGKKRLPGGLYLRGGTWWVERRINGHKFHFSTHATGLRAAMKQLERFEADPHAYRPEGSELEGALVLDAELIQRFFTWHQGHVSRQWALDARRCLVDWANDLQGKSLRTLSLVDDLHAHLERHPTQQHHRVAALRALFKWMRTKAGLVTRTQDVTLELPVPQLDPAPKKNVEWERVIAVSAHLRPDIKDVLELLSATGWHVSEVRRFAAEGKMRDREKDDAKQVLAIIGCLHKKGRWHYAALVHRRHVEAARRIRERGHVIDKGALRKHMLKACAAAGVKPFQLGAMRSSVATWLSQAGMSDVDIAKYVGHEDVATTKRHYIDPEAAALVLPQRVLRVI